MRKDKIVFFCILLKEFFSYPILLLSHWLHVYQSIEGEGKKRNSVIDNKIKVCIHEWGGYPLVRVKKIKKGVAFKCGLKGQVERFCANPHVEIFLSISDLNRWSGIELPKNIKIHEVSNVGMDFSGYNAFFQFYKNAPNSYVILSNTSVNLDSPSNFLEGYINYMNNNQDVGALGISYCTRMIQTFIRPNFTPHLQSFFILTTLDVLREVVALNNGRFPGADINCKLLLIRKGEIGLSRLIQKAGYKLAVVNPLDGIPFKFTTYNHWKWTKGDIRQYLNNPNYITPINCSKNSN